MSFCMRLPFVPMTTHNVASCAVSFRVTCWTLITLPLIYFFLLFLLCSGLALSFDRVHFSHNFLLFIWLLLPVLLPISGPFIFRALRFLSSVFVPGLVVMCKMHIALQEIQAVVLMLHKMAFHLYNKVVAFYIWTTVLLKLIYVIKVV